MSDPAQVLATLKMLESHLVDFPTEENIHMQRKYLSDIRQQLSVFSTPDPVVHAARRLVRYLKLDNEVNRMNIHIATGELIGALDSKETSPPTPDRDGLIEKLEGLKETLYERGQVWYDEQSAWNGALNKAIAIVRQHQAEHPTCKDRLQVQASESSVMGDASTRKDEDGDRPSADFPSPAPSEISVMEGCRTDERLDMGVPSPSAPAYTPDYLQKVLEMAKDKKLELDPYFAYRLVEAFHAATREPVMRNDNDD